MILFSVLLFAVGPLMHRRVLCLLVCVNVFPAPKATASSHHQTGAKISLSTFQSKCLFVRTSILRGFGI